MKATKIFMMAALALTFAACSNDDNDLAQQPAEQPANDEITITATLSSDDGATTRVLGIDGSNIASTWETTDQFAILYHNGTEQTKSIATVKEINGTTVTITFTIPASLANNTDCTIVYPASAANAANTGADVETALAAQDGTIENCPEVRVGTATIDKDNHNLTSVTQLIAQNAIFKFTLGSAIDDTHPLVIKDDADNTVVTVTPTASMTEAYVAMPAGGSTTYKFQATTADNKIAKSGAATITAGKYYQTTLTARYPLALASATADDLGSVITSDGYIYLNATRATAASKTAVAMIAYVGSNNCELSPYNHGLALAMSDADGGNYCKWKTEKTDAGHSYKPTSTSFNSESGLQYNDATHNSNTYPAFKTAMANNSTAAPTGCSAWFLPSGYQWNQMINACKNVLGTNNNYTDLRDGFTNAGGTNLQSRNYWSSTERSDQYAWYYAFNDNDGNWSYASKEAWKFVRSAVAF